MDDALSWRQLSNINKELMGEKKEECNLVYDEDGYLACITYHKKGEYCDLTDESRELVTEDRVRKYRNALLKSKLYLAGEYLFSLQTIN